MKKNKWITVLLCCLVLMTACGNDDDLSTSETGKIDNKLSNDVYSYEFDIEKDNQADLGTYPIEAYTLSGYYSLKYLNDESMVQILNFYDYEQKKTVVVCGKTNCSHDDEECNAYFDEERYPMHSLWYYGGSMYMPYVSDGYISIEKISADGSNREKACDIVKVSEDIESEGDTTVITTNYPTMLIHRGVVYYTDSYPGCGSAHLYKKSLDGSTDAELLDETDIETMQIYRMKCYGDSLFYQKAEVGETVENGGLYRCDIETSEISLVISDVFADYCVSEDGVIYYKDTYENKIMSATDDDNASVFFELADDEEIQEIMWDGDSFICNVTTDNGEKQYVLDESGSIQWKTDNTEEFVLPYQSVLQS